MNQNIDVSIVVPVYKSAKSLPRLTEKITAAMVDSGHTWELLFIDDGSPDETFAVVEHLHAENPAVRGVQLGKNYGQHHATLYGLKESRGDYVVTMDDDLQNPPSEIDKLIDPIKRGALIAIGVANDVQHNMFRRFSSWGVQKLVGVILKKPANLRLSSFRCLSRVSVDMMSGYSGAYPYMPALMFNAAPFSKIVNVTVEHRPREFGKSTYSFSKLVSLASFLLFNHSLLPLRLMVVFGIVVSTLSFGFSVYVFITTMLFEGGTLGWASLAILISFLSGCILVSLGILGEYVGRLVKESSSQSQFLVAKRLD